MVVMTNQKPKTCDKKMKTAELKLQKILNKIEQFKLSHCYVSRISSYRKQESKNGLQRRQIWFAVAVAVFCVLCWIHTELSSERCVIQLPSVSKAIFRPPIACSVCEGVSSVARLANLTALEFEEDFAYKSQPLVITDGATGWRAMQEFNYSFFKAFYSSSHRLSKQTNDCFYFAYKSGLNSLQEVFSMPESRANLSGEPWWTQYGICRGRRRSAATSSGSWRRRLNVSTSARGSALPSPRERSWWWIRTAGITEPKCCQETSASPSEPNTIRERVLFSQIDRWTSLSSLYLESCVQLRTLMQYNLTNPAL